MDDRTQFVTLVLSQPVQEKTAGRCWSGYEPVPGKAPYSDGSCRPKGGKTDASKKDDKEKTTQTKTAELQKQARRGIGNMMRSLGRGTAATGKFVGNYAPQVGVGGYTAHKAHEQGLDPFSAGLVGLGAGTAVSPRAWIGAGRRAKAKSRAPGGADFSTEMFNESIPMGKKKLIGAGAGLGAGLSMQAIPMVTNAGKTMQNVQSATGKMDQSMDRVNETVDSVAGNIDEGVSSIMNQATDTSQTINDATTLLSSDALETSKTIRDAAKPVKDITENSAGLIDEIRDVIPHVRQTAESLGDLSGTAQSVQDGVSGEYNKAKDAITGAWESSKPYLPYAAGGAAALGGGALLWKLYQDSQKKKKERDVLDAVRERLLLRDLNKTAHDRRVKQAAAWARSLATA